MIWKNNKTGKHYRLIAHGADCTDGAECRPVVIYEPIPPFETKDGGSMVFVRDKAEWLEKFRRMTEEEFLAEIHTVTSTYLHRFSPNVVVTTHYLGRQGNGGPKGDPHDCEKGGADPCKRGGGRRF